MATVTTPQILEFQTKQQHGMTLRSAQELLREAQDLVARLEGGNVPVTPLNVNTVGRVLTDHAKLLGLKEALDTVKSEAE